MKRILFILLALVVLLSACQAQPAEVIPEPETYYAEEVEPEAPVEAEEADIYQEITFGNDAVSHDSWELTPEYAAYAIFSQSYDPETMHWNIPGYGIGNFPSEGLFWVFDGEKFGFLNAYDLSVAIPFEYEWANDFHQGVAVVRRDGRDWLIDKNNVAVLPLEYDVISTIYRSNYVLAHPTSITLFPEPCLGMLAEISGVFSYHIYSLPDARLIYSSDVLIYNPAGSNFSVRSYLSQNKFPVLDLEGIETQQLDINGLWTHTPNGFIQFENQPIFEVVVWNDTIRYELVALP